MDSTIARLGQDLARAEYAKKTRGTYVAAARQLGERFGRAIEDITRDQAREFVDEVMARERSSSTKSQVLSGIRFLYTRTLGRPEMVSFFRLPRRHLPLPTVMSLAEVDALLRAIRKPRYQAIAMVMYGAGLRALRRRSRSKRATSTARVASSASGTARATRPARPSCRRRSTSGCAGTGRASVRRCRTCSRRLRGSCRWPRPYARRSRVPRRRPGSRST